MISIQLCLINSNGDLLPVHFISINISSIGIYNLYKTYTDYNLYFIILGSDILRGKYIGFLLTVTYYMFGSC